MAKVDLSLRDRHALKWHLNGLKLGGRDDSKKLDRIWEALKLDLVTSGPNQDPASIDIAPVTYDLQSVDRDGLIDWLNTPMMGSMSRLLIAVDRQLIKTRDGE